MHDGDRFDNLWCPFCRELREVERDVRFENSHYRCQTCGRSFHLTDEKRGMFHHLWGLASRSPGYIKRTWQRFAKILKLE